MNDTPADYLVDFGVTVTPSSKDAAAPWGLVSVTVVLLVGVRRCVPLGSDGLNGSRFVLGRRFRIERDHGDGVLAAFDPAELQATFLGERGVERVVDAGLDDGRAQQHVVALGDEVAFTTPSGKSNCMTDAAADGALACLVALSSPPPRPADAYGEWKGNWVDFPAPSTPSNTMNMTHPSLPKNHQNEQQNL